MTENSTFKETTIKDYLPLLYEAFPDIPKLDIKLIVNYGWRLIYIGCISGCDILIQSTSNNFWFYIGTLRRDSIKHFNYYKDKLIKKFKFLYRRLGIGDDTYYIGLNKEEYLQFNKDLHKSGRRKKKFTFKNKLCFNLEDACYVYYSDAVCILKFKHIIPMGFTFYKENLEIKDPIVTLIKDINKFSDVLVTNRNYELL